MAGNDTKHAFLTRRNETLFFDASFFLYMTAYFAFYQDDLLDGVVRLLATGLLAVSGIMLCAKRSIVFDGYIVRYVAFVVLGFVSMFWAKDPSQISLLAVTLSRIVLMLLFLSVRVRTYNDIRILLILTLLAVLVLDLRVGYLMVSFYSAPEFIFHRFGDNFGFNSNTVAVGNIIAAMTCLMLCRKGQGKKIVMLLGGIFSAVILLTGSKKGILGLVLSVTLMCYLRAARNQKARIIVGSTLAIVVLVVAMVSVPFLYELVGQRFLSMLVFFVDPALSDFSTRERFDLILSGLSIWSDHLLFGCGLNNFSVFQVETGFYAHNNFVELLADTGLIGFLLYYSNSFEMLSKKIDSRNGIQVTLKAIVILVLILDFTMVDYQDIRIQVFLYLAFKAIITIPNTNKRKKVDRSVFRSCAPQMPRAVDSRKNVAELREGTVADRGIRSECGDMQCESGGLYDNVLTPGMRCRKRE